MNPRDFVEEYSIKSLVACFSGGKDSLAVAHFTFDQVRGLKDLDRYVIYVDTGVMVPIATEYVREVCDQQG